jgi:four helix bundle protein
MKENVLVDKSFAFAMRVLRSGTSIGASVEEAIGGQSTSDFLSLRIAYKEARETRYWINCSQPVISLTNPKPQAYSLI